MVALKSKSENNRILFVLDTTHGQIGGTEQNTLRFAQALTQRGYEPAIAAIGNAILDKSVDAIGLKLHNIPATHFENVSCRQWLNLIKESDPLVVIRSKTWIGSVNWRLDIVARMSGVCYLGWEHHPARAAENQPTIIQSIRSFNIRQIKLRVKGFIRTQLHTKAVKRTVAVSNAVREPLIEFYRADPDKVDVIHPGVDFNLFAPQSLAKSELRQQWNIPESAFVIGSLGRLVAHKGNDFTLKVLANLSLRDPKLEIWCVLAGAGPDQDRLKALAQSLTIRERICFPGWQDSAPNTWSAFDLFMMPSSDEGLGMTLIEAVACGCIPLGAAVGGIKEILNGPLEKYCMPPEDIDAWTSIAIDIIRTPRAERELQQKNMCNQLQDQFGADRQWGCMTEWLELHSGINQKSI